MNTIRLILQTLWGRVFAVAGVFGAGVALHLIYAAYLGTTTLAALEMLESQEISSCVFITNAEVATNPWGMSGDTLASSQVPGFHDSVACMGRIADMLGIAEQDFSGATVRDFAMLGELYVFATGSQTDLGRERVQRRLGSAYPTLQEAADRFSVELER